MSLFGSLMRDLERDPIFGAHHRAMNRMMNSFFGAPVPAANGFGLSLMGPPPPMGHHHPQQEEHDELMPFGGGVMNPFGAFGAFPDMSRMMTMDPSNGQHGFSSSSFMSFTSSGLDGRPQVYQATSETRHGPDGVKETRKTMTDSRSGTKKMAVGRHLGEQSHVVEREQNMRTGQMNENHEFYNLDEIEAPRFDREWKHRAAHGPRGHYSHSSSMPAIASMPAALPPPPGPSRTSSYVEQPPEVVDAEDFNGYQPQHSQSSVTIEELPASDDEAEPVRPHPRPISQRSYPHHHHADFSTSSVQVPAAASSSRRSPYGTSKEKRQKRARLGKKY